MSPANGGHFVQDPLYQRMQISCLACIVATDSYHISVSLERGVTELNRMPSIAANEEVAPQWCLRMSRGDP